MTKEKFLEYLKVVVFAIMAGLCISIGSVAFLCSENVAIGAIFFCVGLFVILNFNFNLYTGKLCYVFNNELSYSLKVILTLIGNFIGTNLSALLLRQTRLENAMLKCESIVQTKLNDSLLSLFILAIFCNILIYVAVEGFKSENALTKYLSLFFGVSVFVVCGFEHSVADMFYFAFAGNYSSKAFLIIFIVALGNFVGGTLIELLKKLFASKKTPNEQNQTKEIEK